MISKITEKIRQSERWINLAYYLIYAALFFSALVGTTEFTQWTYVPHIRNMVYMGSTGAMLLLWGLGLALQSDFRINTAKIIILTIGILQFLIGGGSSLILILTILIGATDRKSADIILKESLIIGLLVLCVTYLASMNGYIAYRISDDRRHFFGFIYYSHFSDKLLYLYMMYRCIRHKRESLIGYALILEIVYLNYRYTHARTVTICFLTFILFCAVYDIRKWRHENRQVEVTKTTGGLWGKISYVIAALASGAYIWATLLSMGGIVVYRLLETMDRAKIPEYLQTFVSRLFFNSRALEEYGITAFGQKVYEITNTSGGENIISSYFYLDNSFMRLFIITGVVTLIFFTVYMTFFMWRTFQEKRVCLFAALLVAAIGGLSETYTINFYYNVFLILAFSNLGDIGE